MSALQTNVIHTGDALTVLKTLPDNSINCVVTSPPYFGLRDYGHDGQIGLEPTPREYVEAMVAVFAEVRRVLRDDGCAWVNLGDSYAKSVSNNGGYSAKSTLGGFSKPDTKGRRANETGAQIKIDSGVGEKNLIGIPWRVAFGLQDDGWILRSDIIWSKPSCMPESVTDRPTRAHEYVFLLTKSPRYWYDAEAIQERIVEPLKPVDWNTRKAHGATNGAMQRGSNQQHGVGVSHDLGGRSGYRNARTVWQLSTEPTGATRISRLSRVASDAVSCGMTHIVAPNCPEHGGMFAQVATEFCGGHVDDELIRMLHTDSHPAHELSLAALSTNGSRSEHQRLDSWDYSRLEYAHAAILRSIESRRTGHADATSLACMPFAETLSRTDDKLALLASFVRHWSNHENSTLPDDLSSHMEERIPHRNVDTYTLPISPECTCQFYQKTTRDASHFATMPQKLVRRCIVAGCPVGGVVLDPFSGSGTTALVARREGRRYVGIELNPDYVAIAERRLAEPYTLPMLGLFADAESEGA